MLTWSEGTAAALWNRLRGRLGLVPVQQLAQCGYAGAPADPASNVASL